MSIKLIPHSLALSSSSHMPDVRRHLVRWMDGGYSDGFHHHPAIFGARSSTTQVLLAGCWRDRDRKPAMNRDDPWLGTVYRMLIRPDIRDRSAAPALFLRSVGRSATSSS